MNNIDYPLKTFLYNETQTSDLFSIGIKYRYKNEIQQQDAFYSKAGIKYIVRWQNEIIKLTNKEELDILTDLFIEYARVQAHFKLELSAYQYYQQHKNEIIEKITKIVNPYQSSRIIIDIQSKIYIKLANDLINKQSLLIPLFNISAAKTVYDLLDSKDIIDGNAGWGERMLAAGLRKETVRYVAYQSSLLLKEGYDKMIFFIYRERSYHNLNEMKINYLQKCFSQANVKAESDTFFSAPSFYDTEIYDDNDQCHPCYGNPTYQKWLIDYYTVYLKKAYQCIKVGGYIALYLCELLVDDTFKIMREINVDYIGGIFIDKKVVFIWKKR